MPRRKRKPKQKVSLDDLLDHTAEPEPILEPTNRERDVALVMFWRKETCKRCHRTYEGSAYHSGPMMQSIRERSIVHNNKIYGWRYVGISYRPVQDAPCYDKFPRKVEHIHTQIQSCPACVHRPNIIYLNPPEKDEKISDEQISCLLREQAE